jgi:Uma2 family endonuclease
MPEAVVEILSPGGQKKDLQVGPPFYLSHGVKDVVVVDPEGDSARHFRSDGERTIPRGTTICLECGCEVTV